MNISHAYKGISGMMTFEKEFVTYGTALHGRKENVILTYDPFFQSTYVWQSDNLSLKKEKFRLLFENHALICHAYVSMINYSFSQTGNNR